MKELTIGQRVQFKFPGLENLLEGKITMHFGQDLGKEYPNNPQMYLVTTDNGLNYKISEPNIFPL